MTQILVCGEALIDLTPSIKLPNTYIPNPGGSPFNVAVGLGRLDIAVGFVGILSSDPNGDLQKQMLEQSNVNLEFCQSSQLPSALAFAVMSNAVISEEVCYQFYLEGTSESSLKQDCITNNIPSSVKMIHFGSFSMYRQPQAKFFQNFLTQNQDQCLISFDPNIRPDVIPPHAQSVKHTESIIKKSHLIKVSESDLEWLYPQIAISEVAKEWLRFGAKLVIITRGGNGAMVFQKEQQFEIPTQRLNQVVDTIGAGDSFMASLLAGLVKKNIWTSQMLEELDFETIQSLVVHAQHAARWTCQQQGATLPYHHELEKSY